MRAGPPPTAASRGFLTRDRFGSVAAVATIIIGFFKHPKRPTIDPKVTRRVATFFLIVDVLVSAGWFSWSRYQASDEASRLADVLSTVTLGQNIDVLPGHHATLDVAIAARKDTILLVFQVVDHNADIGSCVPNTVLSVTPDTPGGRGGTVTTSSGVPTSVDLPAGATKLHVDIAVANTRDDQNCGVDLSVVSAKLQNK